VSTIPEIISNTGHQGGRYFGPEYNVNTLVYIENAATILYRHNNTITEFLNIYTNVTSIVLNGVSREHNLKYWHPLSITY